MPTHTALYLKICGSFFKAEKEVPCLTGAEARLFCETKEPSPRFILPVQERMDRKFLDFIGRNKRKVTHGKPP